MWLQIVFKLQIVENNSHMSIASWEGQCQNSQEAGVKNFFYPMDHKKF